MGRSGLSASVCPFITLVWLQNRNGCPGCQHAYDIDFYNKKFYNISDMKRLGESLAVVAASAALLNGDTVQPSLAQMAPEARLAIAERYASCDITAVTTGKPETTERHRDPRSILDVSIVVEKTHTAKMYEQVFEEDDTVVWYEPVGSVAYVDKGPKENADTEFGLGEPVVNARDIQTLEGGQTEAVLSWYPPADYLSGVKIGVYVINTTATFGSETTLNSESVGVTYCGSLESVSDGVAVTEWRSVGHLPGMSGFIVSHECEFGGAGAGPLGGLSDEQQPGCTPWRQESYTGRP
jgi:hypothetical protein